MRFYLGVHVVAWLGKTDVPLFVSRRKLEGRKTFPRARAPWALDSGGFTELTMHGRWALKPAAYVALVRRFKDEVGNLEWAAPQDWMCEPVMLKRTGYTVANHQRFTIDNFLDLRAAAPDLPIIPVLQGWAPDDYARHIEMYDKRGVRLDEQPVVGVGTVCRRQGTVEAVRVFDAIDREMRGLPLHGFGFKVLGLSQLQSRMASADSLAWSFRARRAPCLPGHEEKHRRKSRPGGKTSCANCLDFALQWRATMLDGLEREASVYRQPHLL